MKRKNLLVFVLITPIIILTIILTIRKLTPTIPQVTQYKIYLPVIFIKEIKELRDVLSKCLIIIEKIETIK